MPADDPPTDDAESTSDPASSGGATSVVECPNCSREFEGTYCPDCGQDVRRSVMVGDVLGDFLRGIVDIEGSLQSTLLGLTTRPAEVLRRYLRGARAELMSPGRYLLASVVISFVTVKGLIWAGVLQAPGSYARSSLPETENDRAPEALLEAIAQASQSQWFYVAVALASVGLLSLILWRLLSKELSSGAEALATSAFLIGHASMLGVPVLIVGIPMIAFLTGRPVSLTVQGGICSLIGVVYFGGVTYRFTSSWVRAAKVTLGTVWVQIEAIGAISLAVVGYVLWQVGPPSALSFKEQLFFATVAGFYLLPLLLHGLVEAFWGVRRRVQ